MLCLLSCGSLHSAPHLGCVPERILIILIIIIIIIIIIVIIDNHFAQAVFPTKQSASILGAETRHHSFESSPDDVQPN